MFIAFDSVTQLEEFILIIRDYSLIYLINNQGLREENVQ